MVDYKKDLKKFASSNKFQWYITILLAMFILRLFGFLPEPDFVEIIRYATIGLYTAEGLDQLTNKREL